MGTVFDETIITFHSVLSRKHLPDPSRTCVIWGTDELGKARPVLVPEKCDISNDLHFLCIVAEPLTNRLTSKSSNSEGVAFGRCQMGVQPRWAADGARQHFINHVWMSVRVPQSDPTGCDPKRRGKPYLMAEAAAPAAAGRAAAGGSSPAMHRRRFFPRGSRCTRLSPWKRQPPSSEAPGPPCVAPSTFPRLINDALPAAPAQPQRRAASQWGPGVPARHLPARKTKRRVPRTRR
ncbi:hypothetical protein D623_10031511 [Myotis brandtii]|uniref:Uncharacterized protein n=1 Tax=Myotis brandtii TaxID=109478 RepID=S7PWC6_MYOBR|nr:hypothetical protein D623_10031511 [Myotis brandtii]